MDVSEVEYNEHNDPILWWKELQSLEVTASRTSLHGGNIIITYCGYILKWIGLIFYSMLYPQCTWSMFDQQMRWEECKHNHRKGKVASVVLGDDTGIVVPSNTRIFPSLDFLPTSAFSPAPYLQLKWRSPGQVPCTRSLSLWKCQDSFYSLNSCQVTHQTTRSQKQKGHTWVEISYKDGIVGVNAGRGVIMIVNKDVENSQSRNHVALLLQEFIHICVYRIFLDYVENTAVA